MIEREPVQSTNIRSVGYDPQEMILEVEFYSGSVYQYLNVSHAVYQEFMASNSKGKYLNSSIKPHYSFRRL